MTPTLAYYRKNAGHWEGWLDFRIVDWPLFWAQPMSLPDRFRALSTALVPKLLGKFTLGTSVEVEAEDRFVHTTAVYKWGMCLLQGREVLSLRPDGSMHIACAHRSTGLSFSFEGAARCNEAATRVEYTFCPWFGTTLEQVGEIVGDEVHLTQKTRWFVGTQKLRRTA